MDSEVHFCVRCAAVGINTPVKAGQAYCSRCFAELTTLPVDDEQAEIPSPISQSSEPTTVTHIGHVKLKKAFKDGIEIFQVNLRTLCPGYLVINSLIIVFWGLLWGAGFLKLMPYFGFITYVFYIVLMLSLCNMYLHGFRGEAVEWKDVFWCSSWVLPAFMIGLTGMLCLGLCLGISYAFLLPALNGPAGSFEYMITGMLILFIVLSIVLIGFFIVVIPFILFTFPALVAGRNTIEALYFSCKNGVKNLGSLMVINLAGGIVLLLSIGYMLPWFASVITAAYLQVAGEEA